MQISSSQKYNNLITAEVYEHENLFALYTA